mmetsp:Transcript_41416/g.88262  ORF Transcript_41416/g.88262 Transcript_41416/m.88262 type:complete len:246 (-) Transcript_41416:903-1640(-)
MTSILGGCDRHPIRLSIIHLHRASRFTSHRSFFTAHRANGSSSLQLGTISPDSRRSARVSSLPSPLSTPSQKEGQGQAVMSADRFISLAKAPCIDFRNAGPPADDVASPRTSDVCSSISFNDEPPRSSLIRSSVFRFQPRCGGGPCRGCFPPWPSHSQSSLQTKPRMRARASAGSLSTSSSEIVSMAVCADTCERRQCHRRINCNVLPTAEEDGGDEFLPSSISSAASRSESRPSSSEDAHRYAS